MSRYFKIWLRMTINSIETIIASRFGVVVFVFGKVFKLIVFFGFIYFLFSGTNAILGYKKYQTLLFLMTFTFLGQAGQMFLREAYRFRGKLISGEFDFDLVKPVHPLLRNLAGGFDLMDLITMPIIVYALIFVISNLNYSISQLFLYILMLANGFLILVAIHIMVVALGVITTEVDHLVMTYRDIETMGRFPVDIYKEPLRQILTFAIPIGLMFTVPAKALLGLLSWQSIILSLLFGILITFFALKFWDFAVKKYSSASS